MLGNRCAAVACPREPGRQKVLVRTRPDAGRRTMVLMRDETADLYQEFIRLRVSAVELTDRYRASPVDTVEREILWAQVLCQTEAARALLEEWLARPSTGLTEEAAKQREREPLTTHV
jgi:hypothetical protein